MRTGIVIAPRLAEWAMRRVGIAGITMPWGIVYLLEEYKDHEALIAHEKVHVEQIMRDGAFRFSVQYLWWLITKGYRANPYEVEAYERAPLD